METGICPQLQHDRLYKSYSGLNPDVGISSVVTEACTSGYSFSYIRMVALLLADNFLLLLYDKSTLNSFIVPLRLFL